MDLRDCSWLTLPQRHELEALIIHCDARAWPRTEQIYNIAAAEQLTTQQTHGQARGGTPARSQEPSLPLVGDYGNWDRLGVHRPITLLSSGQDLTAEVAAGVLPSYVPRETDLEPGTGLRAVLAEAAAGAAPQVRLVVITGESAAGKTRAAVEAMRAEMPAWRLLIPHSPAALNQLLDNGLELRRVVVWLDEIQDFLRESLGVEQLQRMLDIPAGPTVLLATLRTDAENALHGTAGWRHVGDMRGLRIRDERGDWATL